MNMPTSSSTPFGQPATNVGDPSVTGSGSSHAASDAQGSSLSQAVHQVRDQAQPMLNRVSEQAEAAARRGIDAVRESSHQLRERALQATDQTVAYVKDEPVKSMLIAAATGAVLMGLVTMLGRSRD